MNDGVVNQVGSPMEIYDFPVNKFVAGFIGNPGMNFLSARIVAKDSTLYVDAGSFQLLIPPEKHSFLQSQYRPGSDSRHPSGAPSGCQFPG